MLLLLMTATGLYGQQASDATQNLKKQAPTIKVAVEEVRLDVVVQSYNGKPITNLTADDFEIYQDNVPQKVLSSVYITNQTSQAAASWISAKKQSRKPLQISPALEREKVNRIIMFIVDDRSMDGAQMYYARMAMRRFVERQMQPGDLVAILRTGSGNSAFNVFVSDKRELLAKIEQGGSGGQGDASSVYGGQLSMLRYGIRALKDMPGRKAVILITSNPTIPTNALYQSVGEMFAGKDIDYKYMFGKAFDRLADEALRAKVVVHMMDIRGLEAPNMEPVNLEAQSVLYKDGIEVHKSGFKPLALDGVTNYDRIPVTQKLALDSTLAQGAYVLELLVRDKNRKEKDGLLSQAMDFQIMPE
jgi:VWFA-related protein